LEAFVAEGRARDRHSAVSKNVCDGRVMHCDGKTWSGIIAVTPMFYFGNDTKCSLLSCYQR